MVLPLEDNFVLNLSASCTRDQAVWRMLGWDRKTISERSFEIPITENGIALQDAKMTYQPDWSLEEGLSRLYKEALTSYSKRLDEKSTEEEIEKALGETWSEIELVETLIERARGYLLDIVDELAKGDQSALRIDQEATLKNGLQHITIRSIDAWQSRKYSEEKVIRAAHLSDDEKDPKKREASILVTLRLLTELYAESKRNMAHRDGSPNETAIAKEIEAHADAKCLKVGDFGSHSYASVVARLQKSSTSMALKLAQLKTSGKLR
jgi:hypothetical protein